MDRQTLNRIYANLDSLEDSLSAVPESDWNDFYELQSAINDYKEKVSEKLDALFVPTSK